MSLSEIQQTQDEKLENDEMDLGAPVKSHKAKVVKEKPKKSDKKKDKDQDTDILADFEFETPGGPTPGQGEDPEEEPELTPAEKLIAPDAEVLMKDDDQTLVPVSYAGVKLW